MLLQEFFDDVEDISRAARSTGGACAAARPHTIVISAPRDSRRRNGRTPRNV
jgi:hypothetical protein